MDVMLFVNELSFVVNKTDSNILDKFFKSILSYPQDSRRVKLTLTFEESLLDRPLSEIDPSFTLKSWIKDHKRDLDLIRKIKSMFANGPFIDRELHPDAFDRFNGCEVRYNGTRGIGIAAAYIFNQLVASVDTDDIWSTSMLSVEVVTMQSDGRFEVGTKLVRHIQTSSHWDEHIPSLHSVLFEEIESGKILWDRKSEIFPCLIFCNEVEKQLKAILRGDPSLEQIIAKLSDLNQAFSSWDRKSVWPISMKCVPRGESGPTLQQFGESRKFTLPDGTVRQFMYHFDFTPHTGRIYIAAEKSSGKCIVASVSKTHLPCVKYRT